MPDVYDISVPVSDKLRVWPGDTPVTLTRRSSRAKGAEANVSLVRMSVHAGTHVDAPLHFITGGGAIETLDPDTLIGPAIVKSTGGKRPIDAGLLKKLRIPPTARRLLLKTYSGGAPGAFKPHLHAGITPCAAEWMVTRGIRLIGIDAMSLGGPKNTAEVHRIVLKARMTVVETLDLSRVRPGMYTLHCLPLLLVGSDGAPARVLLTR